MFFSCHISRAVSQNLAEEVIVNYRLREEPSSLNPRFHIVAMATSNFCKGPITHVPVKTGSVLCYAHASKWEKQEYFNEVIPDEILEHLGWTLQCFLYLKTLSKSVSYFCCAKDMFQWGGRGKRTWLEQKMMRRTLDVDLGFAFCRPTRHRYITDITVVGSGKWFLGREPYGTVTFDAATKLWFQHVSTNTSTSVQGCLHPDWPIHIHSYSTGFVEHVSNQSNQSFVSLAMILCYTRGPTTLNSFSFFGFCTPAVHVLAMLFLQFGKAAKLLCTPLLWR